MNILNDDAWIESPCKRSAACAELTCADCKGKFTIVVKRHHCKSCGQAFCGKCSSTFGSTELKRDRSCIKCASKGLLVRRKAKPLQKASKSIVAKSARPSKLAGMDNYCDKENAFGAAINLSVDGAKPEKACVKHTQPTPTIPHKHSNPSKSTSYLDGGNLPVDDDCDDDEMHHRNGGMLCFQPPTLYDIFFGVYER